MAQNAPADASASQSVFNVPELLEHILLQSSPRDILTNATRINLQWKQLIDTSPSIQRWLCLENGTGSAVAPKMFCIIEGEVFAPIYNIKLRLNPLLLYEDKDVPFTEAMLWSFNVDGLSYSSVPNVVICLTRAMQEPPQGKVASWRREGATWRGMFLSDPPVTTLGVEIDAEVSDSAGRQHTSEIDFAIRDLQGIRLGVAEDLNRSALKADGRTVKKWTAYLDLHVTEHTAGDAGLRAISSEAEEALSSEDLSGTEDRDGGSPEVEE